MLKWLEIYLEQMSCSEEMIQLIRNFFKRIQLSEHYLRNDVNDLLFEILVRSVKFRFLETPDDKILEKINEVFLWELKDDFLELVKQKLVKEKPEPTPKVPHPFTKKKPNPAPKKVPVPKED